MTRWGAMLVFAAACGGESMSAGHVVPAGLCALCDNDAQCETGICRMYGDGYRKCTDTCSPGSGAPQCSAPSQGSCNNMGYCMCPQYQPPADADTSGGFKDAPASDASP